MVSMVSSTVPPGGIIGRTFTSGEIRQSTTTGPPEDSAAERNGTTYTVRVIRIPLQPNASASLTRSVFRWGSVAEKRRP